MKTAQLSTVTRHLRRAVLLREAGDLTDGQLLECFLSAGEEAAFEALMRRHGPMVLGVCRRVLHNSHDGRGRFSRQRFSYSSAGRLPLCRGTWWAIGFMASPTERH